MRFALSGIDEYPYAQYTRHMITGIQRKLAYAVILVLSLIAIVTQFLHSYFLSGNSAKHVSMAQTQACTDTSENRDVLFVGCSGFF